MGRGCRKCERERREEKRREEKRKEREKRREEKRKEREFERKTSEQHEKESSIFYGGSVTKEITKTSILH